MIWFPSTMTFFWEFEWQNRAIQNLITYYRVSSRGKTDCLLTNSIIRSFHQLYSTTLRNISTHYMMDWNMEIWMLLTRSFPNVWLTQTMVPTQYGGKVMTKDLWQITCHVSNGQLIAMSHSSMELNKKSLLLVVLVCSVFW